MKLLATLALLCAFAVPARSQGETAGTLPINTTQRYYSTQDETQVFITKLCSSMPAGSARYYDYRSIRNGRNYEIHLRVIGTGSENNTVEVSVTEVTHEFRSR